jgi:hypothetical protein
LGRRLAIGCAGLQITCLSLTEQAGGKQAKKACPAAMKRQPETGNRRPYLHQRAPPHAKLPS